MNRRLKVLVVAGAMHPEKGSEPGLGWKWIESLAAFHDLWVLTSEKEGNREAIERRFLQLPKLRDQIKVFYVPRKDAPYVKIIFPIIYYRYYHKWHKQVFEFAKKLHEKTCFDLVHQLTMTGYREPGYLWKLDAPFVWGPVGGAENVPLRFASILGVHGFFHHLARNIINFLQLRHNKRVRAALVRADGFVTSTSYTQDAFLRVTGKDSVQINEVGTSPSEKIFRESLDWGPTRPLKLVWSGVHIYRKALPIALKALALIPSDIPWHLDILGQGTMTQSWKCLAKKLAIDSKCKWCGLLSHEEAMSIMLDADVFLFPSLQDANATVVMEALSLGLPIICFDHCGMADTVTDKCGIKISVTSPKRAISDFSRAIFYLAKNPIELARLSEGAFRRSQELTWDALAQQMLIVYDNAIVRWRKASKAI